MVQMKTYTRHYACARTVHKQLILLQPLALPFKIDHVNHERGLELLLQDLSHIFSITVPENLGHSKLCKINHY